MPELPEPIKKWVEALRSKKYRQTKSYLTSLRGDSFCCLGILCEVAIANGVQVKKERSRSVHHRRITYNATTVDLPPEVRDWAGIHNTAGAFKKRINGFGSLAEMNDHGKRFSYITDFIEQHPEEILKEER